MTNTLWKGFSVHAWIGYNTALVIQDKLVYIEWGKGINDVKHCAHWGVWGCASVGTFLNSRPSKIVSGAPENL